MSNISKTILFFGTDDFSVHALQALIDEGYSVVAVVTKPDRKSGRGQKIVSSPIKRLAELHHIDVLQPEKLLDIIPAIAELHPKPAAAVLSSYGKIIPQAVLDLFQPIGIINVHPSLLPLYRGSSPIETAIINGDDRTGVSIMRLTLAMDAGPVYAQETHPLDISVTQASLSDHLGSLGAGLLLKVLPHILDGSLQPVPQDDTVATYTTLLSKADADIDSYLDSAAHAEQKIRAHQLYPKTKTVLFNHPVIITRVHVSDSEDDELTIAARDGSFLAIDELIAPSGRTMTAEAFLRGYVH